MFELNENVDSATEAFKRMLLTEQFRKDEHSNLVSGAIFNATELKMPLNCWSKEQ